MRRLLLTALLLLNWWMPLAPAARAQSTPAQVISARVGTVTRVEGEVLVRQHGTRELQSLRVGLTLSNGDTVMTGKTGRAEWTLNPGSYLQINSLSQVWVYETSLNKMHFDILRGEVFVIVSALKGGAALVLDTPPAELNVVKSGNYRVRVAPDDATEALVGAGKLQLVDYQGKAITVTKGRRVRFSAPERRKNWDIDTMTPEHLRAVETGVAQRAWL